MKTKRTLKWGLVTAAVACAVVTAVPGCELLIDFDRSKIPSEGGTEDVTMPQPDGPVGDAGGDTGKDGTTDAPSEASEAGTADAPQETAADAPSETTTSEGGMDAQPETGAEVQPEAGPDGEPSDGASD
jgi:hypothetical protein